MKIINNIIFYLILFFLPTQLGKHFWPDFSIVSGIRVDYLSPTVYLTDILIIVLFLTLLINQIKNLKNFKYQISNIKFQILRIGSYWMLVILVLFLLFGFILSKAPSAGLYSLLKFFEFLFLGIYVSRNINNLKQFKTICLVFSAGVVLESGLAVAQFFNQSSLNGFFYFLGERTFTPQTPGIANTSLNGELVLRPYGTFSHPNVLAGYLTIVLTMVISNFKFQISNFQKMFFVLSILIGSIALFLTMSRVAIVLWIILLASYFLFNIKKKINIYCLIFTILIIFSIFFSPIRYRFLNFDFNDETFVKRQQLIYQSIEIIKNNPFLGVGLNNYLINISSLSDNRTFYAQPVHNIYLLILVQTGILGFLFFFWFLYRTLKNLSSRPLDDTFHLSSSLLLVVLTLGMFDHYFLTLQQGQLLLSFVFGLIWSRYKS